MKSPKLKHKDPLMALNTGAVLVPNFIRQLQHQTMHIRICPVHHNIDTCSDNVVMDCDIFDNLYSHPILV